MLEQTLRCEDAACSYTKGVINCTNPSAASGAADTHEASREPTGRYTAVTVGAVLGVAVAIGVVALVFHQRKQHGLNRTTRRLRAHGIDEREVARRQHVVVAADLVEGAALLARLQGQVAAGRLPVGGSGGGGGREEPDSALALARATMASKFVAVARERAEARFVIEYRQLVTAKSMESFKLEFRAVERPRSMVTVKDELGRGQSGVVFSGTFGTSADSPSECAIKTRIGAGDSSIGTAAVVADEALLLEALLLNGLHHPGIVTLLAVVTDTAPVLVCTELMANGDLRKFLRSCRRRGRARLGGVGADATTAPCITAQVVVAMATKLASAMAFMEARSIIHRDVAARNVLVGKDATDVKMADLGAARNVHRSAEGSEGGIYTATTDHNPARWMALEALQEAKFSHKSDVFAFGVLLWEILSLGQTPWGAFGVCDFTNALRRGDRLDFPAALTEDSSGGGGGGGHAAVAGDHARRIYALALRCWAERPEKRPCFLQLETETAVQNTVLRAELAGSLATSGCGADATGELVSSSSNTQSNGDSGNQVNNDSGNQGNDDSGSQGNGGSELDQPGLDVEGYVDDSFFVNESTVPPTKGEFGFENTFGSRI
jgi:serine/threonine protein kinase